MWADHRAAGVAGIDRRLNARAHPRLTPNRGRRPQSPQIQGEAGAYGWALNEVLRSTKGKKSSMRTPLFVTLCLLTSVCIAQEPFIKPGQTVLFLGDSITYAGHYVDVVDATLQANGVDAIVINLGLPSETCSGLSEDDHPFPRPNVHTRIDRALLLTKPNVVVACYGMNDGIYHPPGEERFAAYKYGVNQIIQKVDAIGAKLVLMTPPPFDPLPVPRKLVPADNGKFGFRGIYQGYDDVLTIYGAWLMTQSDRVAMVIDLHGPVASYVDANRAVDPSYTVTPDGIHPNTEGHQVIADAILDAWGLSDRQTADESLFSQTTQRQAIMKAAWLTAVGHERPGIDAGLPLDEAREKASAIKQQ